MNVKPFILSITGHDPAGEVGVLADVKTIAAMDADACAVMTSVTVHDADGMATIHDIPEGMITGQVKAAVDKMMAEPGMNAMRRRAVKVGMVRHAGTVISLSKELSAMRNIVSAPGILSAYGERLLSDEALQAWERHILPLSRVLVLRCDEAEVLLGIRIFTNDDMEKAARQLVGKGANAVLLRGGCHLEGMLTALLYEEGKSRFFTTHNMEGWRKHGIGGVMSTAIAVRLAMGDDVSQAIDRAHDYMHSQVVYALTSSHEAVSDASLRSADLYNRFMSLLADNYRMAHDVAFYADRMSITTRYLYNVTDKAVGKSPKQLIAEYILHEARALLDTSRMSVQEVSDELGFSSQAMFCRFFNNYMGCAPSAYRVGHD